MNPLDSLNEQKMVYVSMDGDSIGRHIGQAVLADNPEEVEEISHKINIGQEIFGDWAHKWDGKQISFGGDEGVWQVPEEALEELETIRKDYEYATGFTASVGVGKKMSESALSLLVAKVKGKNQTVFYTPEIENEISKIVEDAKSGHGTSEESKLAEAYLPQTQEQNERNTSHEVESSEPEHPDNNHGYDSGYKDDSLDDRNESYDKQDLTPPIAKKPNTEKQPIIQEAASTDISENDRLMNEIPATPEDDSPEIGKPAPSGYPDQSEENEEEADHMREQYKKPGDLKYGNGKEEEPNPENQEDDATSDEAEEQISQDMGEELPPKESKDRDDLEQDPTPSNFLDQHLENAKDYHESLGQAQEDSGANQPTVENDPEESTEEVSEEQPQEEMSEQGNEEPSDDSQAQETEEPESTEELLDAQLDNAQDMMDEHGVSRPADFNEKDDDMGLSEEEAQPDISEVLKEGLDTHADNIHKEKIINMVGEALEGFKSQKRILDKAKEQAPELYDSCIKMLRAMIELCSLAGIDQSQPEQEVNEIEGQGEEPEEIPGEQEMPEAESEEVPPSPPQH